MNMREKRDLVILEGMKPTQWRYVNWKEDGGGEV